ncbi:MAG: ABC transporter substrate-binding protein [Patescibacteria group bacterium]
MNWHKFFFWLKSSREKTPEIKIVSSNLDKKLLKKIHPRFIPRWGQFRYIGQFLTKKDQRTINLMFLLITFTIIIWGVIFGIKNNVTLPAKGGNFSEALIGQPQFINPLFSSTSDIDSDITSLVYSGLFKFERQKLIQDLASDYSVSADSKTYLINLRKDIKWSDGEPFTADDVVFTFETIQNPEVNSPLMPAFQGIAVEKTDDYAVSFTLAEPFAPFLNSLTVGILPQHIWSDIQPTGIKLAKNNLQPIGAGSWKFSKLTKDNSGKIDSYVLSANENFYQKQPYLKTITFKFYPDLTQAASALKSRAISALSFAPREISEKIGNKNFEFHKFKLPQYTALFFNQDEKNILKEYEVREAMSYAINKNKIIEEALKSEGEAVNSPILKNSVGYFPGLQTSTFNIEKANQLLDKKWKKIQPEEYFKTQSDKILKDRKNELDQIKNNASSTQVEKDLAIKNIEKEAADAVKQEMDPGQTFYRQDKDGKTLSVKITTAETQEYLATAESVAKMWRAVGIQTKIETISIMQISKDVLKDRNYEILLYGEIVGSDPDPYPFWHSSQINYPGLNLSLFVDRAADKLIEEARVTTSTSKREEAYKKFQEILVKETPAIFLYTPTYTFIADKEIKGIYLDQILSPSDRYSDLENWYIKTKRRWKF